MFDAVALGLTVDRHFAANRRRNRQFEKAEFGRYDGCPI